MTLWVDAAYPYLMVFTGDPLADVDRRALAVEPMTLPAGRLPKRRGAGAAAAGRVVVGGVGDRAPAQSSVAEP